MAGKTVARIALAIPLVLIGGLVLYYIAMEFMASTSTSSAPTSIAKPPPAPVMQGNVYTADFTSARPAQFSMGAISMTKKGGHKMLGPIPEKAAPVFTLTDLPAHQFVHVTFDLALFQSWNGSSGWGPDRWLADVVGGQKLLDATFSNCGFFGNNNAQTYPDIFPSPGSIYHDAWTGAAENQTLGAMQSWAGDSYDCSSIYHMDWTFPHSDSKLQIKFSSDMARKGHPRSFGFLSFRVEPLADAKILTTDEQEKAWTDLSSSDPVAADVAVWKFTASGEQATKFLATKLPINSGDPYLPSRVRHILTVLHSDAADKLLQNIPAEQN